MGGELRVGGIDVPDDLGRAVSQLPADVTRHALHVEPDGVRSRADVGDVSGSHRPGTSTANTGDTTAILDARRRHGRDAHHYD
jgi:hypothetical protein